MTYISCPNLLNPNSVSYRRPVSPYDQVDRAYPELNPGCQSLTLALLNLGLSLHTSPTMYLNLTQEKAFQWVAEVEGIPLREKPLLRFICVLSKTSRLVEGKWAQGGRNPHRTRQCTAWGLERALLPKAL